MAAKGKVQDPTEPFSVALVALEGLISSDGEPGEPPPDAEVYLNLFPATADQFNAVFDACEKHDIDVRLDVVRGRCRASFGRFPGSPVVMWHPHSTEAEADAA